MHDDAKLYFAIGTGYSGYVFGPTSREKARDQAEARARGQRVETFVVSIESSCAPMPTEIVWTASRAETAS